MIRLALIAVFLTAAPIWSETRYKKAKIYEDAYSKAKAESERCENAWFPWVRRSALADLDKYYTEMTWNFDGYFSSHRRSSDEINKAFYRCLKLVYPDADIDNQP